MKKWRVVTLLVLTCVFANTVLADTTFDSPILAESPLLRWEEASYAISAPVAKAGAVASNSPDRSSGFYLVCTTDTDNGKSFACSRVVLNK